MLQNTNIYALKIEIQMLQNTNISALKREIQMLEYTHISALKREIQIQMSLVGGEDRRVGVCSSNCGHWKTIIGYMETSHNVAKCSNVYIFRYLNVQNFYILDI